MHEDDFRMMKRRMNCGEKRALIREQALKITRSVNDAQHHDFVSLELIKDEMFRGIH